MDHGSRITEGTFEQVRNHPEVLAAYLGRAAARA
jgi:ABC-type branched-subunit amino acid transport system ATPase component